jgi:hypothetical protein
VYFHWKKQATTTMGKEREELQDDASLLGAAFVEHLKKWGPRKDLKVPMHQFVAKSIHLLDQLEQLEEIDDSKLRFPSDATGAISSAADHRPPDAAAVGTTTTNGHAENKAAKTPSSAQANTSFSFNPALADFNDVPLPAAPVEAPPAVLQPAGDHDYDEEKKEQVDVSESIDLLEWNEFFQCRAKVYHHRNEGKPSNFASGLLKLQLHKTSSNGTVRRGGGRMVMRDGTGNVSLNMAIVYGMSFAKSIAQDKGRVSFYGRMEDEKRGIEMFMMLCPKEDLSELHSKLEELAKNY